MLVLGQATAGLQLSIALKSELYSDPNFPPNICLTSVTAREPMGSPW